MPVMALPAHRQHELRYLVEHSEARAIAVPGLLRGFDHQAMAAELADAASTLERVLAVADEIRPGSTDLTALAAAPTDASAHRTRWDGDQPGSREVAVFLLSGGTTGLPKLIAAHPRRLRLQRPRKRRALRFRRGHRLPGGPSGRPQLPARLPGHPRHVAVRWHGGDAGLARARRRRSRLIERGGCHRARRSCPRSPQRWLRARRTARRRTTSVSCALLQVGGARLADRGRRAGSARCSARTLQQVFGMAEGLLNYTRLGRPRGHRLHDPGPPAVPGRRDAHRRRAATGTCPRASRARCSPAARTRRAATTAPPSRTRGRSPPTAGTAAATSSAGAPTATSSSRDGTRT